MNNNLDKQKQLSGKHKYYGRVDLRACTEGVAKIRSIAIDELKKYPESMSWPDISDGNFIDATYRHLQHVMEGGKDAIDEETGLPHIYAMQFNLMVLAMRLQECSEETTLTHQEAQTIRKSNIEKDIWCRTYMSKHNILPIRAGWIVAERAYDKEHTREKREG